MADYKYTIGGGLVGALAGAALTKILEDEDKKATLGDYLKGSGIGLGLGAAGGLLVDSMEPESEDNGNKAGTTGKTSKKTTEQKQTKREDKKRQKSNKSYTSNVARAAIDPLVFSLGYQLYNPSGKFAQLTRFNKIPVVQRAIELDSRLSSVADKAAKHNAAFAEAFIKNQKNNVKFNPFTSAIETVVPTPSSTTKAFKLSGRPAIVRKGLGLGGMVISTADAGLNIYDALTKAFNKD